MMLHRPNLIKHLPFCYVGLSAIVTFLILYVLREFDDNRLTSWRWAFSNTDLSLLLPLLILGLFLAYVLSRLEIIDKRPLAFLFLISFSVCSIFWSEPEVIVDSSRYFTQAKHLALYGMGYFAREWGTAIHAWTDMPLVPFVYGIVLKFFGESRLWIQICTSLFFSLTVLLTTLTGRALWDEKTGFLAGVFLMGMPYVYSQVPLMLADVPTMFFLALSVFSFIRALENGGAWIPVASLSICAAFFAKYSTWMMLSVIPVIACVYYRRASNVGRRAQSSLRRPTPDARRNVLIRTALVAAGCALLIAIIFFYKHDVFLEQIRFLNEYQRPGLRRWGESFVSTFFFQVHPFVTLAALWSLVEAVRRRDLKYLILCWLILIIIVFQIRRSRYVLIMFPMLALMASYGIQRIAIQETRKYIAYAACAASLIVASIGYLPFLKTMAPVNMVEAGKYINALPGRAVDVYTVPSKITAVNPAVSVPILDLSTNKQIVYHHDPEYTLPFKRIEKSPLRFTWEYRNPEYYTAEEGMESESSTVIVITNGPEKKIPQPISEKLAGYKKIKVFNSSTRLFRYSPVLSIFVRDLSRGKLNN